MHALNISWVDLAVAGVVVLSTILAVIRGFIRETLSIFAWAAAAFAALYFGPAAFALLRPHIATPLVGPLIAYAGVFLVVLIPLSFISWRLSEGVRHSPIGTLDRSLGVPFGILRGLAVVGLVYLGFSLVVPVREQPLWLTEARLLPLVQGSSDVILSLIPAPHRDLTNPVAANPAEASGSVQHLAHAAPKAYPADDRRALDRLIETTGAAGAGKQ
jgi:membrane protein required for colicin V production